MNRKGVCYDVGAVMAFNWRPHFDPKVVRREIEIIKTDLHCNAIRISGLSIDRLTMAAEYALEQGLEVWLSPLMWDKSPVQTLAYITKAAKAAESLRQKYGDKLVFSVGSELTLFMQGILPGRNFAKRLRNPQFFLLIKSGEHDKPLNAFLSKANAEVRKVFGGKVTYASLVWEAVDWGLFDFVGVDHYRAERIKNQYIGMLKPAFDHGKPVVITEFGCSTTHAGVGSEGLLDPAGLGVKSIVDFKSQFLHQLPLVGRFVRPHLVGVHVRDEQWQASQIVDNLAVLDTAGVDGAFVSQFVSQINPYSDDPKYDLDMAGSSLVKYYEGKRRGAACPDMPWEPKESFKAVAEYYAKH
ncbi:MAG TPA: hypothetical protein VK536_04365 [Candidatus Limnocylindrales bacterium]|nr:hypothetical protein [Candidatus Limnocylindrales bacterium]